MKEYIDKSAIKEWLEIQKIPFKKDIEDGVYPTYLCALMDFEDFINSLEVKEADLEKHLKEDIEDVYFDLNGVAVKGATYYLTVEDIKEIAKHFFELGLNTKGE